MRGAISRIPRRAVTGLRVTHLRARKHAAARRQSSAPTVRAASQDPRPIPRLRPRTARIPPVARHLLCSRRTSDRRHEEVTMPLNLDQYLGVHAAALDVRARRSELIANNLANADTPGYQARDLDFAPPWRAPRAIKTASGVASLHHPGRPHRRRRLGRCRHQPGPQVPHAAGAGARRQHRRRADRAGGLRRERGALPGDADVPEQQVPGRC